MERKQLAFVVVNVLEEQKARSNGKLLQILTILAKRKQKVERHGDRCWISANGPHVLHNLVHRRRDEPLDPIDPSHRGKPIESVRATLDLAVPSAL